MTHSHQMTQPQHFCLLSAIGATCNTCHIQKALIAAPTAAAALSETFQD